MISRPIPLVGASSSDAGRGRFGADNGSNARPPSDTVTLASQRFCPVSISSCSVIGCVRTPPCLITFASTSVRQSTSRSACVDGTLFCRHAVSSHSDASRASAPSAMPGSS
jgi:hypothetical protein